MADLPSQPNLRITSMSNSVEGMRYGVWIRLTREQSLPQMDYTSVMSSVRSELWDQL